MGLDDLRLKETIDLADRVTDIRDDLVPTLDRRIEAAESGDPVHEDDQADQLRDRKRTLTGEADAHQRVIDALEGGSAFVIQELMTAETAMLTDDVQAEAVDLDLERQTANASPKEGYHKVRTLELALVDAPEGMESRTDHELGRRVYKVGKLPDHTTDYLYECAVSLNDTGEVDGVGNLSDYGVPDASNSSDS